eukprot:EG_transcript_15565
MDSFTTSLEKLTNLLNGGIITVAEFEQKKSVLVNQYIGLGTPGAAAPRTSRLPATPRAVGRVGAFPRALFAPAGRGKGWVVPFGVGPVYGGRAPAVRPTPYQRPGPAKQLLAEWGTSVKVQPVPEGIDEQQLAAAFAAYGEVVSAAVHRGTPAFGHVNFATREAASAVAAMGQVDLCGLIVSVTLSRRRWEVSEEGAPNAGIAIFNLPLTMTREVLLEYLSVYPGLQTVKLALHPSKGTARDFGGQFKGYAFAYFDSVENATVAKDQLTGALIEDCTITVKYCNKA